MPPKKSAAKPSNTGRPVIVCTERRLVQFGYATEEEIAKAPTEITITNSRTAIRWGTTKGIGELAATGPTSKSNVGARIPSLRLFGITAILDVTSEAASVWERA